LLSFEKNGQKSFSDDAEVTLSPLMGYNNLVGSGITNTTEQSFGFVLKVEW